MQGLNILFVLSFENEVDRKVQTRYYLQKIERKDYNIMIDGKHLFYHPVKNYITTLLLEPLLKTGLPLIGIELKPLGESVLIPLGLTGATSATDATIHKNMFGSEFTTLINCN